MRIGQRRADNIVRPSRSARPFLAPPRYMIPPAAQAYRFSSTSTRSPATTLLERTTELRVPLVAWKMTTRCACGAPFFAGPGPRGHTVGNHAGRVVRLGFFRGEAVLRGRAS
jgi:hypothetical protein